MAAGYDKVVVIGLDGADWRLLHPWIEQGKLPTLARLLQEGTHGPLQSTIRPESSVAWSSFATGVNPGKHGVFGFVHHQPGSYQNNLANGATVGAPRFWDILGEHKRKVGLLHVPFTYPPTAVNGFLVSGMMTPTTSAPFTHPPELKEKLLAHFASYRLDAGETLTDKAKLVADVTAFTNQQQETARLLLADYDWDFFTIVFTGPDRLQHKLWADTDPSHPHHEPHSPYGATLLAHFQQLDTAVAEIWSQLPANSLLLLMSDHGFNGVARRFFINRWLQAEGYLHVKPSKRSWRQALLPVLQKMKSVPALRRLKRAFLPDEWGPARVQVAEATQAIDWQRTQLYYAADGGLRLNLQGREPQGIVSPGAAAEKLKQSLTQKLLQISDPLTGQTIIAQVYAAEALYHGRFARQAPDLIVEPRREAEDARCNVVLDGRVGPVTDGLFGPAAPYSGNHAPTGILIAWGPDVQAGHTLPSANITDLAPTILAAMDVPIPETMDGRLLTAVFAPGKAPTPVYTQTAEANEFPAAAAFDAAAEEAVSKRLRELGYLE